MSIREKLKVQIVNRNASALTLRTSCPDDEYYKALSSCVRTLRVSSLGAQRCDRKRLLEAFGKPSVVPQALLDIFELGHAVEPLILKRLVRDGWSVEENNADDRKLRFLFPLRGGFVTGTPDAVVSHETRSKGLDVLCDAKTMNENRFTAWLNGRPTRNAAQENERRRGAFPVPHAGAKLSHTETVFPEYYFQVSAYAMAAGLDVGMITGYNKNTSACRSEMFATNPELVNAVFLRAELALTATDTNGISGCRGNCGDCFYRDACKGLFGTSGMAELKKEFARRPPLMEDYDPVTVLAYVFDLTDERGRSVPAPSKAAFSRMLGGRDGEGVPQVVIAPELMSEQEREEAAERPDAPFFGGSPNGANIEKTRPAETATPWMEDEEEVMR